jgi:predicted ATPase/transcriptional regulator with XRE-family HTH domain
VSPTKAIDDGAQTFGEWLKKQRRRLDWTQEQLAGKCFCSVSAIRKIESGDLAPSRGLVEQLAAVLFIPDDLQATFSAFARGQSADFLAQSKLHSSPSPLVTAPAESATLSATPAYTLPAPLTALVGRERELHAGSALLRRSGVRLVTLIGPPGAGKTRLSLALAEELKPEFVHGACFVALEPISDPALVLSAIAHALQVHEAAGASLVQSLREFLYKKQLLLLLDNFEQVMDAAPVIAELLVGAPRVKAIVTSRESLRIYGEYEFPVSPLAVPDLNHLPTADLLEMYPAVELFVQRGQAVRPTFAIDAHNAAAVAQICAWLDGLPLAIEMAAARLKWQTPANLLAQLRQQLLSLTGEPRDLTPRQQTLRGAIDWSFNLLGEMERRAFLSLAVVSGGCIADHAAAISEGEPEATAVLLRGLVEKSLLDCAIDSSGELRFSMLQTMREYAQTRLAERGALSRLRELHAATYAAFAEECLTRLHAGEAEAVLNRLEIEHNNLRSALSWHLQFDVAGGLRLAVMLTDSLWGIRGYFTEGRGWLEKFLHVAGQDEKNLAKKNVDHPVGTTAAWLAVARLAIGQGDLPAAEHFAQHATDMAMASEEDADVRAALRCRAAVALHQSDYPQASALYQQALDLCRPDADQKEAASTLNGLGLVAKDQGDYARALDFHERARALYAALGDPVGAARALTYASIAAYWQADFIRCIDFAQQSVELQAGVGDVVSITYSREVIAIAYVKLGRLAEGTSILEECLAEFHRLNDRSGVAVTLVDLGQAAFASGEYERSLHHHRQAVRIAQEIGDRRRIAFALEGIAIALARLAEEDDETSLAKAVICLSASETLRQKIGTPLPQIERPAYEACLSTARARLAPVLFATAWTEGSQLTLADLAAF